MHSIEYTIMQLSNLESFKTVKSTRSQGFQARGVEQTISFNSVLPSLVSLMSPAPPTSLENQRK